jgi:hypothetical protein
MSIRCCAPSVEPGGMSAVLSIWGRGRGVEWGTRGRRDRRQRLVPGRGAGRAARRVQCTRRLGPLSRKRPHVAGPWAGLGPRAARAAQLWCTDGASPPPAWAAHACGSGAPRHVGAAGSRAHQLVLQRRWPHVPRHHQPHRRGRCSGGEGGARRAAGDAAAREARAPATRSSSACARSV